MKIIRIIYNEKKEYLNLSMHINNIEIIIIIIIVFLNSKILKQKMRKMKLNSSKDINQSIQYIDEY